MQSLLLETTLVILEEPAIQRHPALSDCSCWYHFWTNFLEQRRSNVRHKVSHFFVRIKYNRLCFRICCIFLKFIAKCYRNRYKEQDLLNLVGAMYSAVLFLGATNTASVQPIVAVERTVFYRERAAGMYSALPYAFAQVKEAETFISS